MNYRTMQIWRGGTGASLLTSLTILGVVRSVCYSAVSGVAYFG